MRPADGRRMQWWEGGAPDGVPIFFLHGCPDTRHAAYAGDAAAQRTGVRLIAVNRPGYGTSDACASTQLSVADDVVAVADQLGIDSFAVLGVDRRPVRPGLRSASSGPRDGRGSGGEPGQRSRVGPADPPG